MLRIQQNVGFYSCDSARHDKPDRCLLGHPPVTDRLQFEPFVEATVIDQIRLMLLEGFRLHPQERRIPQEMIAAAASWTIYGAVKQWVNTPDRAPAEDFVSVAIELVQPVLSAGLDPVPVPNHS